MMKFSEIFDLMSKRGYVDKEPKDHYRVFYEFGTMDFLTSDVAKKFECEYKDGEVEKIIMTQFWFGRTTFKEITDIDELREYV